MPCNSNGQQRHAQLGEKLRPLNICEQQGGHSKSCYVKQIIQTCQTFLKINEDMQVILLWHIGWSDSSGASHTNILLKATIEIHLWLLLSLNITT